jgi:hypothetical protein
LWCRRLCRKKLSQRCCNSRRRHNSLVARRLTRRKSKAAALFLHGTRWSMLQGRKGRRRISTATRSNSANPKVIQVLRRDQPGPRVQDVTADKTIATVHE